MPGLKQQAENEIKSFAGSVRKLCEAAGKFDSEDATHFKPPLGRSKVCWQIGAKLKIESFLKAGLRPDELESLLDPYRLSSTDKAQENRIANEIVCEILQDFVRSQRVESARQFRQAEEFVGVPMVSSGAANRRKSQLVRAERVLPAESKIQSAYFLKELIINWFVELSEEKTVDDCMKVLVSATMLAAKELLQHLNQHRRSHSHSHSHGMPFDGRRNENKRSYSAHQLELFAWQGAPPSARTLQESVEYSGPRRRQIPQPPPRRAGDQKHRERRDGLKSSILKYLVGIYRVGNIEVDGCREVLDSAAKQARAQLPRRLSLVQPLCAKAAPHAAQKSMQSVSRIRAVSHDQGRSVPPPTTLSAVQESIMQQQAAPAVPPELPSSLLNDLRPRVYVRGRDANLRCMMPSSPSEAPGTGTSDMAISPSPRRRSSNKAL